MLMDKKLKIIFINMVLKIKVWGLWTTDLMLHVCKV